MSTPTPTPPEAKQGVPPALQDSQPTGRPQDFGLDVRRLRRTRAIVFAILALPILALGLLAVKFVSMPITQAWHHSAYEEADYPTAIDRLQPVWLANWFEPYLPHLTRGTDLLQQGDNAAAEEELREALAKWNSGKDLNQPLHAQCKIINNLAISIERQAEEISDPAERAERLYEAEEMMAVCGSGGGGEGEEESEGGSGNEDSETTEENGERIREKRREADEEAGNDPDERGTEQGEGSEEPGEGSPPPVGDPKREDPEGDGPEEEAPTDGGSEEQEKQDELEERNDDAQGGDGEDDTDGGEQEEPKPW